MIRVTERKEYEVDLTHDVEKFFRCELNELNQETDTLKVTRKKNFIMSQIRTLANRAFEEGVNRAETI